ncbi:MAG: PGF-pre-PGF domain-containing protein, partial [Methanosarcinales archaeon]|nr:PGF-pre-PGF domain-containing protein [Methanosarcinales archaeon]
GEAYANIALSENIEQEIIKNRTVSYEFVKSGNDILFLNLTPVVNYGTVFATIEILRNTSTLVGAAPPGIVYRNMNIWVGPTGFADKVQDITISFVVERSWINENGIAASTIQLYRYDRASQEWTSLPTSVTGRDDTHVYFTADAAGFAGFAITGRNEPTSAPVMPESPSVAPTTAAASSGVASATPKSGLPAPGALSVAAIIGFAALLLKRRRG